MDTLKRNRIIAVGLGLAAAAALVWFGSSFYRTWQEASLLPEPPDLSAAPTLLAQSVRTADDSARDAPTDGERVLTLCTTYHANGFTQQAVACYARVRQLDPHAWKPSYLEALIAEESGDVERTASLLSDALDRHPTNAVGWYRLGQSRLKQSRLDDATRAFDRAIDVERNKPAATGGVGSKSLPVVAYASLGLARVELEKGDGARARARLEKLLEAAPGFGPALLLLGRIERQEGNEERAGELTERAQDLPPYVPPADPVVDELARSSRSTTYLLKQLGTAIQSYNAPWAEFLARRAVESNDKDADAIAGLGLLLLAFDRVDEALPHLEKYRGLNTKHDQNLLRMGRGLVEAGRAKDALPFLRDAMKANPRFAPIHESMCFAHAVLGRVDDGVRACELALQLDEKLVDAHINLSALLTQRGRFDDAMTHANRALELRPHAAQAHNNVAMIQFRRARYAEAKQHLEKALRIHPQDAQGIANLARTEARLARLEEAEAHAKKAIELDPRSALAHLAMAESLSARGEWVSALEHITKSVGLHPDHPDALAALAWVLATCPQDDLRDGTRALRVAQAASKRSSSPAVLDALAAAHAEVGEFDKALETIEIALTAAKSEAVADRIEALERRKAGYAAHKPYRQPVPGTKD